MLSTSEGINPVERGRLNIISIKSPFAPRRSPRTDRRRIYSVKATTKSSYTAQACNNMRSTDQIYTRVLEVLREHRPCSGKTIDYLQAYL